MEHRSRIYTESGGVAAVVNITNLGDGRLNVAVAVSGGDETPRWHRAGLKVWSSPREQHGHNTDNRAAQ
jgi:hypothetical protein